MMIMMMSIMPVMLPIYDNDYNDYMMPFMIIMMMDMMPIRLPFFDNEYDYDDDDYDDNAEGPGHDQ